MLSLCILAECVYLFTHWRNSNEGAPSAQIAPRRAIPSNPPALASVTIPGIPTDLQSDPAVRVRVVTAFTLKTNATVEVGGQKQTFEADRIGMFPRVHVLAKATIPIHLSVGPHEFIREQVLDGGRLNNNTLSQAQFADKDGNLDFQYQVRTSPGSYRVAIERQGVRQMFDFWVGPDLPLRVPSISQ